MTNLRERFTLSGFWNSNTFLCSLCQVNCWDCFCRLINGWLRFVGHSFSSSLVLRNRESKKKDKKMTQSHNKLKIHETCNCIGRDHSLKALSLFFLFFFSLKRYNTELLDNRLFSFFKKYLYWFLEGEKRKGREEKKQKHINLLLPDAPNQGWNLQLGHLPWLGN